MIEKNKGMILISVIAIAAVLGTVLFTAYAEGEDTSANEETLGIRLPLRGGRMGWLSDLSDEQRAELQAMREEFHNSVQTKLTEWGVQIEPGWLANLTDEQHLELQTIEQEFRDAVNAKLEEWGIDLPEFHGPNGWLSNLTDEQRAELQAMREEFHNSVQTKLTEWGVEAPEFPNRMGFDKLGQMRHRCRGVGFAGSIIP